MMDLMDVINRLEPRLPMNILQLDPYDPEWEDDMNYMYPNYGLWKIRATLMSGSFFMYAYNYQILNYNAHWRIIHKIGLFFMLFYTSKLMYCYRKDVLRANLFDEYVQFRADELVEENIKNIKSEPVKKYMWYYLDLKETLSRAKRQSYFNKNEDFKDAELVLQDFIRRHTDETRALPLSIENARIGAKSYH